MKLLSYLIPIGLFLFFSYYLLWDQEVRLWNNGFSSKTKLPWQYFATDSSGAKGYFAGDEVIWITFTSITSVKTVLA